MGIAADKALARLKAGNERFAMEMHGTRALTRPERAVLAEAQSPWATILTCADSRVAPEIVFNQGLGDLFVARVAGNVAGTLETATVEYGAAIAGTELVVVLGHAKCAAVETALAHADGRPPPSDSLTRLVETIGPAIERAKSSAGDRFTNTVKANALIAAERLRESTLLKGLIAELRLQIVAAYYDIASGKVSWL